MEVGGTGVGVSAGLAPAESALGSGATTNTLVGRRMLVGVRAVSVAATSVGTIVLNTFPNG